MKMQENLNIDFQTGFGFELNDYDDPIIRMDDDAGGCYMKHKPRLIGDVVNHLNAMIITIIKELNWKILKP